jgi:hypothetical protein
VSNADDIAAAEKTYRAIGRFVFEFSQAEYTIRHHLAEEIGLAEEHFVAVVMTYDVAMLCTVATEVFNKSREKWKDNAAEIEKLIKVFRRLNDERNRVAHGLWVPWRDGGTVHHVPRNLKPSSFADQAAALEKLADEAARTGFKLQNAFFYTPPIKRVSPKDSS